MSEFEDNLWNELLRDHADDLARDHPSPVATAKPTRRAVPGALVGIGLAALGAVLVLVLGASNASPAFAVTRHQDGTVTVSILRPTGVAAANTKLHQLGIRAKIVEAQVAAGCAAMPPAGHAATSSTPSGFAHAHWIIDPRHVPAGKTLLLTAGRDSESSDQDIDTNTTDATGTNRTNWVTITCPNTPAPPWAKRPADTGTSGNSGTSTTNPDG
jgi:hypothetical protein